MSLEQALADFGREIGVQSLAPGPEGTVQLRFESGAILGVGRQGAAVVVHLAEPVPAHEAADVLLRAMKQAATPDAGAPAWQVGLFSADSQDWLVHAMHLPEAGFDAPALRQAHEHLRRCLAQLGMHGA
ncbi:MAG: type III secretion chaperone SycN [Proteobacteria bacterium]|jgi:type III secretion system chaperone SycN|nr:type III secretion chaperone SycN [Pseudomonadota bacterium]